ncbi:MAG: methyltransferase domain-containing protein [Ectothiorhodospiraceae bacterium]|nr:methyltransferase domain-containing protein [Ectothiorhodospiraceae bacterium]
MQRLFFFNAFRPLPIKVVTLLITVVVICGSACSFTPQSITIYPAIGEDGDLAYLGPAPQNSDWTLVRIRDTVLTVFGTVLGPTLDSLHLLNNTQINPGERVLDLGTGSGIQAIFAARITQHVVATDISPQAVENTRFNSKQLGLEGRIDVREGDLFSPLASNERFDVILLNLKYPYGGAQHPLWKLHERFFANVKNHLRPNGRIYYQFGYESNQTHVKKMLLDNQLYIADQRIARTKNIGTGLFLIFEIRIRENHSAIAVG